MNPIWSPQPKQRAFQARREYEALYGGAAGGGKSDALLTEALRQVHIPHYRALILRKTHPQLRELIDRSRQLYPRAFPGARFVQTAYTWFFPSGAQVQFGAIPHAQDRTRFQGMRYDFIGFDELTHFTWQEYSYLLSRNRPGGPGTRVYVRATANPGGVGHGWVRDRFVTPAPPLTPIRGRYRVLGPEGPRTYTRSRVYVPATVFDNGALLKNDPNYLANLAMLPEMEQRALLYGDWNSFEGQVFRAWRNDPAHYRDRLWTHVIDPFRIPAHWRIYRGFDFGYAKPFSVGWYAVDERGCLYRIAEYYGCTGAPNVGVQLDPAQIAANIRKIEAEDVNLRGRAITGVADPSIFDESRGESVAQMMAKPPNCVYWGRGDNTRIPGKMQLHYRLAFDPDGRPLFQVFSTCPHFIRTVPALVYDPRRAEDVDTAGEDHIYDECRYVMMENPIPARPAAPTPQQMGDDPLNLRGPF